MSVFQTTSGVSPQFFAKEGAQLGGLAVLNIDASALSVPVDSAIFEGNTPKVIQLTVGGAFLRSQFVSGDNIQPSGRGFTKTYNSGTSWVASKFIWSGTLSLDLVVPEA